jgi:hypothetical protein
MSQLRNIFVSYSHRDAQIATEIASRLEDAGLPCFLAERDIFATQLWEPRIRDELRDARCLLILLTPRSRDSKWVAIETGAAWILEKQIVPATMFIEVNELTEPLRQYQVRPVETNAQITTLIQELQRTLLLQAPISMRTKLPAGTLSSQREFFNERANWDRLLKIGEWHIDDNSLIFHGEGEHNYLLSHYIYGHHAFHISGRLRFTSLRPLNEIAAVNAGVVFGWRSIGDVRKYYHVMFTGSRLLLELIGARGGPVFSDFQHTDEGVLFILESGRFYKIDLRLSDHRLSIRIDDAEMYTATIQEAAIGRIGIRPWRSRIESDHFEVCEGE